MELRKYAKTGDFVVTIEWKKGKTPRGHRRKIGELHVDQSGFIQSAKVDPYLQGLGIGYEMYRFALQYKGLLKTQYSFITPQAKSVWMKLSKKYPSKKQDPYILQAEWPKIR